MNIETNSKSRKYQFSLSSMVLKSNLVNLNVNKISPSFKNNEKNKRILLLKNQNKNINKKEFNTNDDKDDKSTSNLTSIEKTNESNLINNHTKQQSHLNSSRNITNSSIKKNLLNNCINSNSNNSNYNTDEKSKNKEYLLNHDSTNSYNFNSNTNEIKKRCRHKQVKREIYANNNKNYNKLNNNNNKINFIRNSSNKLSDSEINQNEYKSNKSITISIDKIIKDNFFYQQKKNKSLLEYIFLKNKLNKKAIKNNIIENSKENKENIEINNNKNLYNFKSSTINSKIRRMKSPQNNKINKKNNSISKYINRNKIFKNSFYKINSREKNIKENNDIYFDENELNEKVLSTTSGKFNKNIINDQMVNKVHHFGTECNKIFNKMKNIGLNDNIMDLNQIHNEKIPKEKKVSCNTIITNNNDNNEKEKNKKENENIRNIIKNNLDYKLNKKKNILRKYSDNSSNKLSKVNTDAILENVFLNNSTRKKSKNESLNINQDYYSSENNDATNSISINKEVRQVRKRYKSINLNIQTKNPKPLKDIKNTFYALLKLENFIKIFFSFCERDNDLRTKFNLISKEAYKKIKPLIFEKISYNILKYNENKNDRNKIKIYLMKNNSSLIKLSPVILRKKYTDLIFENNNQYDIEIKKDLTRTFPNDILFKYGNAYYNKLYHILTAYSNFNKNIGYIQGLNFISAHIIYFFEDEIEEFNFLDAMINKFELDKIFLNNQFLKQKLEKINLLLVEKLPKLNTFLSNIKLNFEFFITSWILTLFSNSMETEFLSIIWDYIIIFGWNCVKYFILNILTLCENDIINSSQNNLTYIQKNIFKNENFKKNFHKLINDTVQSMIKDDEFI